MQSSVHEQVLWCAGRVDDVINVSGHRIGTAEVESALVNHPACAEAAVVPVEHPIKGQGIYAFITLMDVRYNDCLLCLLHVRLCTSIPPASCACQFNHFTSLRQVNGSFTLMRVSCCSMELHAVASEAQASCRCFLVFMLAISCLLVLFVDYSVQRASDSLLPPPQTWSSSCVSPGACMADSSATHLL